MKASRACVASVAGLASVVALVACGGSVEGSDAARAGHPPGASTAAPPTPTAGGPPTPVPMPSDEDEDQRPVTASADVVTLRYGMLGEPRAKSSDECSPSAREYAVDVRTWQASASICTSSTTADGRAVMHVTNSLTVPSARQALLRDALGKIYPAAMPKTCGYDGPAYELATSLYEGETQTYLDADYNCQHRTSVRYVASSLQPLQSLLDDILLPGG